MHAVIKTGGKQYRVTEGQILKIETLDATPGEQINFEEVLMINQDGQITIGAPHVAGGKVMAEVLNHGRGEKIRIIKFKRRKHHMKRQGHRQNYTEVKITAIQR